MGTPNFFIVGAAKSGTTSLYNYLDQHPDVYMSPIKEPHYFSKDIKLQDFNKEYREHNTFDIIKYLAKNKLEKKHIAYINDLDSYLQLFREQRNEKCIGEMSSGYLYSKEAAQRIYDFNPHSKIIVILRNPIERTFSHWLMGLQIGLVKNQNFLDAVMQDYALEKKGWGISYTYIELGLYFEQIKRYYDIFPSNNIKIFLFDDLQENAKKVSAELFAFLDINLFESIDYNKKYNVTKLPKNAFIKNLIHNKFLKLLTSPIPTSAKNILKNTLYSQKPIPKLTKYDRESLIPFFKEDIKKLEYLINRNLTNWYTYAN